MEKIGITDKVKFLLQLSKSKQYSSDELKDVVSFTSLHSNNVILGRVFGFSVSDYAFATLFWLGTPETIEIYNNLSKGLSTERKAEINDLLAKKLYEQC